MSNHALALDGIVQESAPAEELSPVPCSTGDGKRGCCGAGPASRCAAERQDHRVSRLCLGTSIPPPDQLAEPVSDRPRILEAPEIVPPRQRWVESPWRPSSSRNLRSVPVSISLCKALRSGCAWWRRWLMEIIIAAAAALFGFIFWKVAAVRPPMAQIVGAGAAIPCLFWLAYQYLLIVYGGQHARLARGWPRTGALRRDLHQPVAYAAGACWRASCPRFRPRHGIPWVFLDEDALCWHDRITHTYLAPHQGKPRNRGIKSRDFRVNPAVSRPYASLCYLQWFNVDRSFCCSSKHGNVPEGTKPAVKVFVATTVMLTFISFWRASAIVLSDLASSAYYAGGDAEKVIGKSAPWFILGGHAVQLRRAGALYRIQQHVRSRRRIPRGKRGHGRNAGQVFGIGPALRLRSDWADQRRFCRAIPGGLHQGHGRCIFHRPI